MSVFLTGQSQVINYSALLTHQNLSNLPIKNSVKGNEVISESLQHWDNSFQPGTVELSVPLVFVNFAYVPAP